MTTYYRDPRGRSLTDEEIAREWIRAHPERAAEVIQSGRSRPEPRPFAVHTKDLGDGRVRVEPAHPDNAA